MTFEEEANEIALRIDGWLQEMRTDIVIGQDIQNLDSFAPTALRRVVVVATMAWRRFVSGLPVASRKSKRAPLIDRGARGPWSQFERSVFDSITSEVVRMAHDQEIKTIPMFSKRLAIAQLMLDAFDDYLEGPKQ